MVSWPVLALAATPAPAQTVVFDGRFSNQPLGNGPIYNILAGDGRFSADGQSLFYSFDRFSLATGETANFASGGAQNIVSRVTGNLPSSIAGTINAGANFYFINPNGITFSDGATVNVAGAFAASTADSILFDASGQFSASQPDQFDSSLLTISGDPSGFSYSQTTPASIRVDGLTGNPGQSILLAGGDVMVNGLVRARGGLIEITGLAVPGTVEIIADSPLGVEIDVADSATRSDITLSNGTLDVSIDNAFVTFAGGSIGIKGDNIDLLNDSAICAGIGAASDCNGDIFPSTPVNGGEAGNILLDATGRIRLLQESAVVNRIEFAASGNNISNIFDATDPFGSILVNAESLEIDGVNSLISATSRGTEGNAGLVIINVETDVSISGGTITDPLFDIPGGLYSQIAPGTEGNAGGIIVRASSLKFLDNALITSRSSGQGNAGEIQLFVPDILIDGADVISTIGPGGTGEAGNILIQSDNLRLTNGAAVSTSLEGTSTGTNVFAGNLVGAIISGNFEDVVASILVFSDAITIENGSSVTASATGTGNSGGIFMLAGGDILLRNQGAITSEVGPGNNAISGAILLFSERLGLSNSSKISVENQSANLAGAILVSARAIGLARNSEISAETNAQVATVSGLEGSIFLDGEFLSLSLNSNIRTDASGLGDGGDIQLNITNTVYASPSRDSNITANATGTGGNIVFPATLLLRNIAPRDQDFPDSNDITATGQFSDGTISFQSGTQDVNPVRESVTLPNDLVDASSLIAQGCAAGNLRAAQEIGELVVTGRGGLPPSPSEQVSETDLLTELAERPLVEGRSQDAATTAAAAPAITPVVEAQGWHYREDGDIVLTAQATGAVPTALTLRAWRCDE